MNPFGGNAGLQHIFKSPANRTSFGGEKKKVSMSIILVKIPIFFSHLLEERMLCMLLISWEGCSPVTPEGNKTQNRAIV